jgi:predicted TIM-barrel fold metal-dependent hydrolase
MSHPHGDACGCVDVGRRVAVAGVQPRVGRATTAPRAEPRRRPRIAARGAADTRIDVHYHIYPPRIFTQASSFADQIRSLRGVTDWEPSRAADALDRDGVRTAVISFANPTLWSMDHQPQRRLARLCNDYFAQVVRDNSRRFGVFACLPPLDDVEGALVEIEYAFDTLKVEGVRVMTSYRDSHWLGDPIFAPVWDELDRRAAVVFVHPELACFNRSAPLPSLELPLDTARTGLSLWRAGAFVRWPRIQFIFCHAGGPLPMLTSRFNLIGRPGPDGEQIHDADLSFRNAYFDTAQAASPSAMAALLSLADPARILFGSDTPFAPAAAQASALAELVKDEALLRAIERDNALALMPGLGR